MSEPHKPQPPYIPTQEIPGTAVWRIYDADTGELISVEEGETWTLRPEHIGRRRVTRTVGMRWTEENSTP